jgi:transcriptional regulator with XRE-family HTH domain
MKTIYTKEHRKLVARLREARLAAGFTQVQVAKALKRPQSFVAHLESGQRRVDFVELRRFAKLYRKPLSYFEA